MDSRRQRDLACLATWERALVIWMGSSTKLRTEVHGPQGRRLSLWPVQLSATFLGPEDNSKTVDGVGVFETEMYMSGMHGGHGGGKTSSFKRCLQYS